MATPAVSTPAPKITVGTASWYGLEFHGRKRADGGVFDAHALTAAHRTLPFGTRLKVTNLANNRSVEVRVADRGPFTRGRIIDVSLGAARRLGFVKAGTAKVRIEPIDGAKREAEPPASDR